MINPQELRLGNWVEVDGKPVQIDGRDIYWMDWNLPELANFNPNPIPLTPELLEAAGFYSDYDGNLRKDLPARMELFFNDGNHAEMDLRQDGKYISFKCAHIRYLHQLQNFLFQITGQELEIKLPVKKVK